MSDSTHKLSATLKAGPGYEAPWIVLYAETAAEMVEQIKAVTDVGLDIAVRVAAQRFQAVVSGSPEAAGAAILGATPAPDTAGAVATAQGLSEPGNGMVTPGPGAQPGTGVGNYPSSSSSAPPAPPQWQQQNQQLPAALAPSCPTCGGPTIFKVDQKSSPPAWKGWFCQNAPRGTKHDVTWVK